MQTILPMPASGQPRRGRPFTGGSRSGFTPRSRLRPAGVTTSGVMSSTTFERSRSWPAASTSPGRSAPARPYRTSFMGDRSVGGQAGHRHHEVEIAAQLVDPPHVVIDERGALRFGEIDARERGRRVGLEAGPELGVLLQPIEGAVDRVAAHGRLHSTAARLIRRSSPKYRTWARAGDTAPISTIQLRNSCSPVLCSSPTV